MLDGNSINFEVPEKLEPLLAPKRYKGAYGGRGGAKSHFFAGLLIVRCRSATTRWACIREVQNSIRESVRQLLIDKINDMGLEWFFDVKENEIRGQNDSLIVFKGMQSYNATNIKSLEGYDGVWVEEAQTLSDFSLRMLRPTIRREGSEIWFSWNPRHDTDAVDKFFRGPNPPADSVCVDINWQDNPWFPQVLRNDKDADYAADPEMAEHVWGGGYEIITESSYYARLIAQAEKEGRLGHYPYDPSLPVITSWDIGIDDYTAVWFWQVDQQHVTAIDYWETHNEGADEIVAQCMPEIFLPPPNDERFYDFDLQLRLQDLDRPEPYIYGQHYLPHDVKMREWGAGGRSRVESLASIGVKPIRKGAATGPADRIASLRKMLPITRFNQTKRVDVGLKRLRRYRRKWNDHLQTYQQPLHDENSHGADAAGEYAVNCPLIKPEPEKPERAVKSFNVEMKAPGVFVPNMSVAEMVEQRMRKRRAARRV